jgi:signal transduction histidine kinase
VVLRPTAALLCALVCSVATLAVADSPVLRFAYADHGAHVAIETAATLISMTVAFLFLGRFQRTRLLHELMLASALSLTALSNLLFNLTPSVVRAMPWAASGWASIVTGAAAVALIAASSLLQSRTVESATRAQLAVFGISTVPLVAGVFIVAFGGNLPAGVQVVSVASSSKPRLEGDTVLIVVQLLLALAFGVAAAGFFRLHRRTGDELSAWLAIASIFGAFSRFNYFLFPSLYTDWVYTGDVLRLGFYLALLVGAAREIASYWRSAVDAAQLEERRRIARDIHDGLAQEIAFIGRNARLLLEVGDPALVDRLVAGAERARVESRRVVAALASTTDEPLDIALARAARDAAYRFGAAVQLQMAAGIELAPAGREALLRITAEAVANAARHGDVHEVRVELERHDRGARLRVIDKGRGFTLGDHGDGGFGLISMRERAEALGGSLRVRSEPGAGTEVEVVL